jgi:hypothetical protein
MKKYLTPILFLVIGGAIVYFYCKKKYAVAAPTA